jgi:hypothetical protein
LRGDLAFCTVAHVSERTRRRPVERSMALSSEAAEGAALAARENAPRVVAGRYELLEPLGEGGFAITHRARDARTGEDVVVKEVLYRKIEDPKTLELLEREARVLAHLRHPRIPRFVEFLSEREDGETRLYLVQGYVPGRSLAQWARDGKHFTEREVVRMALEAARILAHLHQLQPPIVHRDVKPGNLVLDESGSVWLVDFGAVRDRILDELRTEGDAATIVGTYGYMPFEQFQGRALPASDVYALGMTLVFLLSHKEPHEIETAGDRTLFGPHVRVSRGLRRVLERMVAVQPEGRYPSAVELVADLEALLAGERTAADAPRRPFAAAAGLALALAVGALAAVVAWPTAPPPAPIAPAKVTALAPRAAAPHVQVLGHTVRGRLAWDGQPLEALTDRPPNFWLRREKLGEVQGGTIRYDRGRFEVSALPQGSIGMQTTVDLNPANPRGYPGDLYAFTVFEAGARSPDVTVDLWKIIRLRTPQDTDGEMPGWGLDCSKMFVAQSPVDFEWDAPAEGLLYRYSLQRVECPYANARAVTDGTTTDLRVSLPLAPNGPNDFYLLNLSGSRGPGKTVGSLITHGRGGMGWDYRFRVR